MPPEYWVTGFFATSDSPNSSRSSAALRLADARPKPCKRENSTRFSLPDSISSSEANCPVRPMSWRTTCGS